MVDTEFKRGKALGYSNGYAAGRKKGKQDVERQIAHDERVKEERAFWDAAFIACMNGTLVNASWGKEVDGVHKKWTTGKEYAAGSANIADNMLTERRKRRP